MLSMIALATAGLLDWTTGCWTGAGQMQGQPSVVTAGWSAIGYGGVHRLTYAVRWTSAKGAALSFAGEGSYWAVRDGAIEGLWLDSGQSRHALEGLVKDKALAITWASGGRARGRSHYALGADGAMTITDWAILPDGAERQFAQSLLKPAPADQCAALQR